MTKDLLSTFPKTEFVGYEHDEAEAKVIGILADNMSVEEITEGEFTLVLDRTPFYGESGGQVGDTGTISGADMTAVVNDTKKADGVYLHFCTLQNGVIRVGDTVRAAVNAERRNAIRRNHSALHLLQGALREVLGNQVEQAGSYVDEERGRFDFTHFAAMTPEELDRAEALVNARILRGIPVQTIETDIDEAKKMGAMMLFGEKYGKLVRVVKMGEVSAEFCGGTHVANTAMVGLFHIISETSVAAGVRRIECVTGMGVLAQLREKDTLIHAVAKELKVQNSADVAKKAAQLQSELSGSKREVEMLNAKLAAGQLQSLLAGAFEVRGVRVLCTKIDMQPDAARALADQIKADHADTVAVLALPGADKVSLLAVAGKDAVAKGIHAGKLVGTVAAVMGGKGGGRPDSAMAGGKDADKLDEALMTARKTAEEMIH